MLRQEWSCKSSGDQLLYQSCTAREPLPLLFSRPPFFQELMTTAAPQAPCVPLLPFPFDFSCTGRLVTFSGSEPLFPARDDMRDVQDCSAKHMKAHPEAPETSFTRLSVLLIESLPRASSDRQVMSPVDCCCFELLSLCSEDRMQQLIHVYLQRELPPSLKSHVLFVCDAFAH